MEAGFGGPVWHASASGGTYAVSELLARRALAGVGDASLGEWVEMGRGSIVHVRRRLTPAEAARVNPLRDVRGTPEETLRLHQLAKDAPHLRGLLQSQLSNPKR